MDANINTILGNGETIVWEGSVNRKVMLVNLIIGLLITLGLSGWFFTQNTIAYTQGEQPKEIAGWIVGSGILLIGLLGVILNYISNLVKKFAITQKRAIIKSGIIGTDFESITFDQIKNVVVDVGLVGKIFSVGSVKIDIGKTETYSSGSNSQGRSGPVRTRTMYSTFLNIEKPYEVYKYFQQSLDQRKESLYSGRADTEAQLKK